MEPTLFLTEASPQTDIVITQPCPPKVSNPECTLSTKSSQLSTAQNRKLCGQPPNISEGLSHSWPQMWVSLSHRVQRVPDTLPGMYCVCSAWAGKTQN